MPQADALFLSPTLGVVVTAVLLVAGARLRGDRGGMRAAHQGWRIGSLTAAALLLVVACFSPLATLGAHYLLTAHLVQNLLLMGCVPPLLLLALPPAVPVADSSALGRGTSGGPPSPWLRAGRALLHPTSGLLLFNGVFVLWHASPLYDLSLQSSELYAVQQATLLLVSLLFWWPIAGPGRPHSPMQGLSKLFYILLATIPQTFTGLLYAMASHPLYQGYAAAPRLNGLSALSDQQIGGACLALLSKVALFVAFSVVMWRVLDGHSDEGEDDDRDDHRGGDAPRPVPGLPAWLADVRAGRTADEPAMSLAAPTRMGVGRTPAARPQDTAPIRDAAVRLAR